MEQVFDRQIDAESDASDSTFNTRTPSSPKSDTFLAPTPSSPQQFVDKAETNGFEGQFKFRTSFSFTDTTKDKNHDIQRQQSDDMGPKALEKIEFFIPDNIMNNQPQQTEVR